MSSAEPPGRPPMSDLERHAWACAYLLLDELRLAGKTWGTMAELFEAEPARGMAPEHKARLATLCRDAQSAVNSVIAKLTPRDTARPT